MDKNDLARFLDGGLPEEEHASAVAHLSASDEDAELLADAAAVLRDLEAEDGSVIAPRADDVDDADPDAETKIIPLRPPSTERTRRRLPTRWLALAAMVAGVVLVPLALSRSGGGPGNPGQYAGLLANREAGLPPDWGNQSPWPVTRGGGTPVVDNARAAQLGALHVDLELAAAARQAEQTLLLAARIEAMLADVPAAGLVASTYREIGTRAGQPPQALAELLEDGRENVAMFVDEDHFALGAWAEAARLAAASRDAEFFAARASRKMLDRAGEMSLDPEAASAVDAIRAAARRDGQPDWAVLEAQTKLLLGRLGS
ncbi:MAG TPA: hypothetical protein VGC13_24320 [Longimicrobium sp.]|jgi:hypothetical protein|uniref:hypothetical protein n=1 Tax=Longimicrobium sp. TaxID=2029185 RepID=UPI002ED9A613